MLIRILRNIRAIFAVYFSKNMMVCFEEVRRILAAEVVREQAMRTVTLDVPGPGHSHNCSILRTPSGWLVAMRAVNYTMTGVMQRINAPGGPFNVDSQTWMHDLEETFAVRRVWRLRDEPYRAPDSPAKNGLEDPRIVWWRGEVWGLWSGGQVLTNDWENVFNTMMLGVVRGDAIEDLRPLPSPHGSPREKNWMPWQVGDELRVIYSVADLQVFRVDQAELSLLHQSGVPDIRLRGYAGGSQVVPWGEDWICVVHYAARATRTASAKLMPFYYLHRFLVLTSEFKIKAVSREFFLEERGLQFCAGLAVGPESVVLSYSRNDTISRLMELSHKDVEALFES